MKKRNIFYCLASICLSCIWASCDKLPASGKLDGFWQVTEVQFARNGIYDSVVPMKDRDVFWGIQLGLLNIQGIDNGETSQTLCRFSFTGDQLAITDVYINRRGNDSLITDPAFDKLKPTGITGNRAQFQIEKLDANQMQLRSDFARIMFRKF